LQKLLVADLHVAEWLVQPLFADLDFPDRRLEIKL
jgi:hypothetical protein